MGIVHCPYILLNLRSWVVWVEMVQFGAGVGRWSKLVTAGRTLWMFESRISFFLFFFPSSMKTVQWSAYLIADKCNSVMSGAAICTRCSFFSNCGIVVEQHTCPGYGKPSLGRPLSHGGSCNGTWWPRRSSLSWPCINLKAAFWCCHWIRTGEHQVTRARSIKGEKILYLLKWK